MADTNMFPLDLRTGRFFKIVSIISFCLILFMLISIIQAGSASAYEFSIYEVYPWYFWVFLLSALICGQIVILGSAVSPSRNNYWILGMCAILVSNALLLFIPVIRGYYSYDEGDVLTHIGYMKDIINTASIGGNHYPIDHILGVIIHLISGLSLPDVTLIVPPFFSFFVVLSIYFIGKTIFKNKFELLILVTVSSILIFKTNHQYFTPNAQALFLVPLIIYLAFKLYHGANFQKYNFLLLLMSFLIVFYHPLVTVMVIIILILMQIVQYILGKRETRMIKKVNFTYNIFFILLVFSLWSTYLSLATHTVEPIFNRIFFGESTPSELMRNFNILSQVNVDVFYLIRLILNVYGQGIIFGILSLLCIGFILLSIKNQEIKPTFYLGFLMIGYIAFLMLSVVMLFINGSFGFERIYSLATFFCLLLVPTGAYYFIYKKPVPYLERILQNFDYHVDESLTRKRILKLVGILFIVGCITYFSTFNLYHSPIIKYTNQQITKSDYIGMNTFFTYRSESLPILESGPISYRFDNAIYGYGTSKLHVFDDSPRFIPPDHFGYQNETLSHIFYADSKYLLVNDRGRGLNLHVNPEFESRWSFSPGDFERLKSDDKIQQVYSNRNLEIFLVSS